MLTKLSEASLQAQCIKWFRHWRPDLYFHLWHIPNGGWRTATEAMRLKAQGVLSGVPDLFLSLPAKGYGGAFFELKVGRNKLSDNQEAFIAHHKEYYQCHVIRSLEEFEAAVRGYLG